MALTTQQLQQIALDGGTPSTDTQNKLNGYPGAPSVITAPYSGGDVLGATDPYSQWGGAAAYNSLKTGFNNQKSNIYGSSLDAANALSSGYTNSIQDTIHSLMLGQQGIDQKATQNEASKIQGGRDITDMVGRGIRSGGVRLSQGNAGSSSAAQAIANAYGQLGQREMSKVGNQYAQNQGDINLAQTEQNYQLGRAPEKFEADIQSNVSNIVSQARDKFAALDSAMSSASLPDRIAIEQEKENVRQQVLGVLGQFGGQLRQGLSGIKAAGADDIRAKASQQLAAGKADPNLFSYNTQAPAELQNTGPFASELPIFTYNKSKIA